MSSLPTCVEEGFNTFFKILYFAYEMKSYKLTTLQPSSNVKQVEKNKAGLKVGEVCSKSKVCKKN
jgi:hypothetical protein